MRGKFRNSLSKAEPFTPGKPEKIEFRRPELLHTFQVSEFRHPQQFLGIPNAKPADSKAAESVFRGGADGSQLRVLVMQ